MVAKKSNCGFKRVLLTRVLEFQVFDPRRSVAVGIFARERAGHMSDALLMGEFSNTDGTSMDGGRFKE